MYTIKFKQKIVELVVLCAMLSKISPLQNTSSLIQFVGNGSAINLHTCSKNNEIKPLAYNREEEFNMWSQMDEETDWLVIDCYLKNFQFNNLFIT